MLSFLDFLVFVGGTKSQGEDSHLSAFVPLKVRPHGTALSIGLTLLPDNNGNRKGAQ